LHNLCVVCDFFASATQDIIEVDYMESIGALRELHCVVGGAVARPLAERSKCIGV
jgi:hypothetical protein